MACKTEWHRALAFNRLGESIAASFDKSDHVLVDGQLVRSKYERENASSKKTKEAKSLPLLERSRELRPQA